MVTPGGHGLDGRVHPSSVRIDLGEDEGIPADRFDAEWLKQISREVTGVGDDRRRADMNGEREHVAVLVVDGHRLDERGWGLQ